MANRKRSADRYPKISTVIRIWTIRNRLSRDKSLCKTSIFCTELKSCLTEAKVTFSPNLMRKVRQLRKLTRIGDALTLHKSWKLPMMCF